jgi:flagellar biosynthesis chaperone FliJ
MKIRKPFIHLQWFAIDKDFLATHFQGVEKADEHISAIIAEYEKTNLPLVKNRDEILAEKKAADKKAAELQEKYTALEAANKELNEKLESGLPDKEKQIYQADIEKYKTSIAKITEEYNTAKAEYEGKINDLTKEKTDYIIGEELTKLINANPAIYPALKDELRKVIFFDYPKSSFEPFDYNGKIEYVNKDGKKMADLLNSFLQTDAGKHFLQETNNGGGAPGSAGSKGYAGKNPFAKDSINLTEQARLLKENPTLANTLKSQAAAK